MTKRRTPRTHDDDDTTPEHRDADAGRSPGWLPAVASVSLVVAVTAGFGAGQLGDRRAGPVTATAGGGGSLVGEPPVGEPLVGEPLGVDEGMPSAQSGIASWWPQRVVFSQRGLTTQDGRASVFGLDASAVDEADVERAARLLGLDGRPQADPGGLWVGSSDGSGPTARVTFDGWASLGFSDPSRQPQPCTGILKPAPSAGGSGGRGVSSEPNPGVPALAPGATDTAPEQPCQSSPQPSGRPLSDDAAARQARALVSDLVAPRVGDATLTADASSDPGSASTYVTVRLRIEGQDTGVAWSASYTGSDLAYFSGPLAPVVDLGQYPVVGPVEAVNRLADPRFGMGAGGPMTMHMTLPMPMPDAGSPPVAVRATASGAVATAGRATTDSGDVTVSSPDGAPVAPAKPPTLPGAGARLPWPVRTVVLTAADLGWSPVTIPGGAVLLLPSYSLSDGNGGAWSVLAVADPGLDFADLSR